MGNVCDRCGALRRSRRAMADPHYLAGRQVAAVEALEARRLLASTLIAVPSRRDIVFDDLRDTLYVTTSSGAVQRYDVVSKQLLAPWQVGGNLYAADITPDKSALYITDGSTNGGQARLAKITLGTGAISSIPFAVAANEGGAWQIAIA